MKVYVILECVSYEGSWIYAVFSTREKAEDFLYKFPKEGERYPTEYSERTGNVRRYFEIKEWTIDEFTNFERAKQKKELLSLLETLAMRRYQLEHKGEYPDSKIIRHIPKTMDIYYKRRDEFLKCIY